MSAPQRLMSSAQSLQQGAEVTLFETEDFAVVVEDGPVFAEAELFALRLEGVDHGGGGTVAFFPGGPRTSSQKTSKPSAREAGDVMEIEPLHAAAIGIARAPRAGDDDSYPWETN